MTNEFQSHLSLAQLLLQLLETFLLLLLRWQLHHLKVLLGLAVHPPHLLKKPKDTGRRGLVLGRLLINGSSPPAKKSVTSRRRLGKVILACTSKEG